MRVQYKISRGIYLVVLIPHSFILNKIETFLWDPLPVIHIFAGTPSALGLERLGSLIDAGSFHGGVADNYYRNFREWHA